jgi:catechol 2,3-dioxygenase-like lactoylglutathione lyase family enzyme
MLSARALVVAGALILGNLAAVPQDAPRSSAPQGRAPALINACLITENVQRPVEFYGNVLQIPGQTTGTDYAEFHTDVGVLAIFSAGAQEKKYIPGAAQAAANRSLILEFRVKDVDREYAGLQPLVKVWIKHPSTQPWGTRAVYFRDPDGNLVDFYQPARPH